MSRRQKKFTRRWGNIWGLFIGLLVASANLHADPPDEFDIPHLIYIDPTHPLKENYAAPVPYQYEFYFPSQGSCEPLPTECQELSNWGPKYHYHIPWNPALAPGAVPGDIVPVTPQPIRGSLLAIMQDFAATFVETSSTGILVVRGDNKLYVEPIAIGAAPSPGKMPANSAACAFRQLLVKIKKFRPKHSGSLPHTLDRMQERLLDQFEHLYGSRGEANRMLKEYIKKLNRGEFPEGVIWDTKRSDGSFLVPLEKGGYLIFDANGKLHSFVPHPNYS